MSGIADPAEEYFKDGLWGWDAVGGAWVKLAGDPDTGALATASDDCATTPVIYNLVLTSKDTEYSQVLPANCVAFRVFACSKNELQLAFVEGESGTNYICIHTGTYYSEDHILVSDLALYIQCGVDGEIAQIVAWT